MKQRKKRTQRRASSNERFSFSRIIAGNTVAALQDESYALIQRVVDDLMKDPELREKIEYHAHQIAKAILEKL